MLLTTAKHFSDSLDWIMYLNYIPEGFLIFCGFTAIVYICIVFVNNSNKVISCFAVPTAILVNILINCLFTIVEGAHLLAGMGHWKLL